MSEGGPVRVGCRRVDVWWVGWVGVSGYGCVVG